MRIQLNDICRSNEVNVQHQRYDAYPNPNATFVCLVKQLDGLGLAYLHMIEPRSTGTSEHDAEDASYGLSQ